MQIPSQWQGAGLSQVSLVKGFSTPPEMYIPLWLYSGSYVSSTASSSGTAFVQRGSTSTTASKPTLHTLNASWNPNNKYAFEAAIWTSNASNQATAALWDITSNSLVGASALAGFSTTATVLRSGQFTLIPGHQYGISIWSAGATVYMTDASLIVFPS